MSEEETKSIELSKYIQDLKSSLFRSIDLRQDYHDKLLQIVDYYNKKPNTKKKLDKPEQFIEWFIDDLYQYLKEEGKI
jgi:hypothetical protein